ncbi:hypothetical protein A2U01_0113148, partial [Trifolium medium]|nr:hypothetical protein [Trifolium medium]
MTTSDQIYDQIPQSEAILGIVPYASV